jgi:hypothetical protein
MLCQMTFGLWSPVATQAGGVRVRDRTVCYLRQTRPTKHQFFATVMDMPPYLTVFATHRLCTISRCEQCVTASFFSAGPASKTWCYATVMLQFLRGIITFLE